MSVPTALPDLICIAVVVFSRLMSMVVALIVGSLFVRWLLGLGVLMAALSGVFYPGGLGDV